MLSTKCILSVCGPENHVVKIKLSNNLFFFSSNTFLSDK